MKRKNLLELELSIPNINLLDSRTLLGGMGYSDDGPPENVIDSPLLAWFNDLISPDMPIDMSLPDDWIDLYPEGMNARNDQDQNNNSDPGPDPNDQENDNFDHQDNDQEQDQRDQQDYENEHYDEQNNHYGENNIDVDKFIDHFRQAAAMNASQFYNFLGGNAAVNYNSDPVGFSNACAMRLSYALNQAGLSIGFHSGQTISGDVDKDGTKEWYFYKVSDMLPFLNSSLGQGEQYDPSDLTDIDGRRGIIGPYK